MIDKVIAYSKLGRQAQTLRKYAEERSVRLIIISGQAHSLSELYIALGPNRMEIMSMTTLDLAILPMMMTIKVIVNLLWCDVLQGE